MQDFVTEGDIAYIKSEYPDEKIEMPTVRQQRALMLHLRGLNRKSISKAIGEEFEEYKTTNSVVAWLKSPTALALVDMFRARELKDVRASRDHLTELLFQSYHKAGSALEEVAAIREIGKMHGLYKEEEMKVQARAGVIINQTKNVTNIRQLEKLSEDELMQIAQGLEKELNAPDSGVVATQPSQTIPLPPVDLDTE